MQTSNQGTEVVCLDMRNRHQHADKSPRSDKQTVAEGAGSRDAGPKLVPLDGPEPEVSLTPLFFPTLHSGACAFFIHNFWFGRDVGHAANRLQASVSGWVVSHTAALSTSDWAGSGSPTSPSVYDLFKVGQDNTRLSSGRWTRLLLRFLELLPIYYWVTLISARWD